MASVNPVSSSLLAPTPGAPLSEEEAPPLPRSVTKLAPALERSLTKPCFMEHMGPLPRGVCSGDQGIFGAAVPRLGTAPPLMSEVGGGGGGPPPSSVGGVPPPPLGSVGGNNRSDVGGGGGPTPASHDQHTPPPTIGDHRPEANVSPVIVIKQVQMVEQQNGGTPPPLAQRQNSYGVASAFGIVRPNSGGTLTTPRGRLLGTPGGLLNPAASLRGLTPPPRLEVLTQFNSASRSNSAVRAPSRDLSRGRDLSGRPPGPILPQVSLFSQHSRRLQDPPPDHDATNRDCRGLSRGREENLGPPAGGKRDTSAQRSGPPGDDSSAAAGRGRVVGTGAKKGGGAGSTGVMDPLSPVRSWRFHHRPSRDEDVPKVATPRLSGHEDEGLLAVRRASRDGTAPNSAPNSAPKLGTTSIPPVLSGPISESVPSRIVPPWTNVDVVASRENMYPVGEPSRSAAPARKVSSCQESAPAPAAFLHKEGAHMDPAPGSSMEPSPGSTSGGAGGGGGPSDEQPPPTSGGPPVPPHQYVNVLEERKQQHALKKLTRAPPPERRPGSTAGSRGGSRKNSRGPTPSSSSSDIVSSSSDGEAAVSSSKGSSSSLQPPLSMPSTGPPKRDVVSPAGPDAGELNGTGPLPRSLPPAGPPGHARSLVAGGANRGPAATRTAAAALINPAVADVHRPRVKLHIAHQILHEELQYGYKLGAGGFGTVYRGLYREQDVAIKKINIDEMGNMTDTQRQEMEKEIEALSKLEHPCLVKFIGACLEYPNLSVITEYMAGGSLHHLLHINKVRLVYEQQLRMSLQLVEGVKFLHLQKPSPMVHRDLKSLNIVLDGLYNCKICDFGLTRTMDKTHMSLKEGGNGGSPRYMAPECYATNGKLTEKVDIWAAGCILSEIFGGGLPFEECTQIQQIVKKLLMDQRGPHIPRHLATPVRNVIVGCLQFDHVQRLTADEIFQRLSEVARATGVAYANRRAA